MTTAFASLARPSLPALPALLVFALALGVVDAATAGWLPVSAALTVLESALVAPWALVVLRLPGEGRAPRGRWGLRPFHVLTIALVALCLASKWVVLVGPQELPVGAYRTYTTVATALALVGLLGRGNRLGRLILLVGDQPARLMLLSFGLTALLGALILTLPASRRSLADVSFADALFMATSAVCVTGLTVHDVATTYTGFGQAAILALIQAGGLGIMVLSTFFAILAGRRLRLRSTALIAESMDIESLASLKRQVVKIVILTLACEALGALALYFAFLPYPDMDLPPDPARPLSGPAGRVWSAAFHAVSAFCNAGFSLFPRSLAPLAEDLPVNLAVMALIVLGGLGFPVVDELLRRAGLALRGARAPRLSLHARTVLVASGVLTLATFVLIALLEWERSLGHLSWPGRLLASLFQAVTARTAGFNTVDFGALRPATLLVFAAAMFIGASPGSTGGGIKTTTFAALVATLRAVLLGQRRPRLFDRTLPDGLAERALGVAFLSGLIVAVLGFVLLLTEAEAPERVAFEAVSAFGTVGLSTGITPELSPPGRLLVTFAMLIGRIGPLTLALALAGRAARPGPPLEPAEERVLVG